MGAALRVVEPLPAPPHATVRVPGSKSITNRALLCAALAEGTSELTGVLAADDSAAMLSCITQLGATVEERGTSGEATITGVAGHWPRTEAALDARLSGTTSRFVLPSLALGAGSYTVDGLAPLRRRPMGDVIDVLRAFEVDVVEHGEVGHLPVTVYGHGRLRGGALDHPRRPHEPVRHRPPAQRAVRRREPHPQPDGHGRVAALPRPDHGRDARLRRPRRLGRRAHHRREARRVPGGAATQSSRTPRRRRTSWRRRPSPADRSRSRDWAPRARQGDARFADVLGRMGATVERGRGPDDGDRRSRCGASTSTSRDQPDMAQTLAVVAVFAEGPTTVRGVAVIREHETDRIARRRRRAASLRDRRRRARRRLHHPPGYAPPGDDRDLPRPPHGHELRPARPAGRRASPSPIPDCVAKTFPGYWGVLDSLGHGGNAGGADFAPWIVVKSNDKKRARINAMRYLLAKFDYEDKDHRLVGEPDTLIVGRALED